MKRGSPSTYVWEPWSHVKWVDFASGSTRHRSSFLDLETSARSAADATLAVSVPFPGGVGVGVGGVVLLIGVFVGAMGAHPPPR